MKKKIKKVKETYVAIAVVVLITVVSFASLGFAQQQKSKLTELTELATVLGNADVFSKTLDYLTGQVSEIFGASGTRLPNGISADTTSPIAGQVRGTTLMVTATTTLQEITLGSRFSTALIFTPGATTTPGGLFAIQNTGATKICGKVHVDFSVGSTTGGEVGTGDGYDFSVTTSTSGTLITGTNQSLLVSSTLATSTTGLFESVTQKGAGIAVAGQSWLWTGGEYIIGQYDNSAKSAGGADYSTSTVPLTGMTGSMYVDCVTR